MESLMGFFLAALFLLTYVTDQGLKRVQPDTYKSTAKNGFPTCRTHNVTCVHRSLDETTYALPQEIEVYLKMYNLPTSIVSRYVCPYNDVMIWWAPRVGNAQKGVLAVRRI